MEKIKFEKRELVGKKIKKVVEEGFVPSVVYNAKGESTNIKIDYSSAAKIIFEATSTTILDAEFGKKNLKVLVKEVDVHPITEQIRHVAFFEIDESKEMVFTIPFEIKGIAPAVKNNQGVLIEVLNSIDVKCRLSDLVSVIEVDVSKLEHPGQSISVNDIEIPKGMSLINDELENATILTITELQKETVVEEPVEVEGEDGEEAGVEDEEGEEKTEAPAEEKEA